MAYDVENRLLSVNGSGASLDVAYDPLGRLAETSSTGTVTQFLYAGDALVAEYNGAGTLLRRYTHGAVLDEPLVWYEGSTMTDRRWLLGDERGSIIAETDGAGVASIYAYDAFGIPKNDIWTGSRFRYTGQIVVDASAKLYHYKARVYDPKIGRFFQTDPIGYEDQLNLYTYVGNDPINGTDPTGMQGCSDMSNQGLSGVCFDASNFKKSIADTSLNIVATPEADAAVSAAGPDYAVNDAERGFRVDGSSVSAAGTPIDQGKTSTVVFQRSELKGADAFGHSHPENVNASESQSGLIRGPGTDGANPGPGDGGATLQAGMPNYITHQGRTVVIEVSGGQARVRVISGAVNRIERNRINSRLRSMQRSMK